MHTFTLRLLLPGSSWCKLHTRSTTREEKKKHDGKKGWKKTPWKRLKKENGDRGGGDISHERSGGGSGGGQTVHHLGHFIQQILQGFPHTPGQEDESHLPRGNPCRNLNLHKERQYIYMETKEGFRSTSISRVGVPHVEQRTTSMIGIETPPPTPSFLHSVTVHHNS